MGPKHAILGDITGVDLPQMAPNAQDLSEEKNMARYSKSKEFKRIKEWCEGRIAFYQNFYPDGREISDKLPSPEEWVIANTVIKELTALMNGYVLAEEIVKEVA